MSSNINHNGASKTITARRKTTTTRKQANALIMESEIAVHRARQDLERARVLANKAGLSVHSNLLSNLTNNNDGDNTGGRSNTDHVVLRTGNRRLDRIAQLKRQLLQRQRSIIPEQRGEDRWNRPRQLGTRRRRIQREKDLPEAPPEPPLTGYVCFVGQMTTKIRHDRPNQPHDQSKVLQEISKLWKIGLSPQERMYYNQLSEESREEYHQQLVEYRATGYYHPSQKFVKLEGANIWIRTPGTGNSLENEIAQYATCQFPKRPPTLDKSYAEREKRSKLRRKLKLKGLLQPDGTLKDGLDFETLLLEQD